jgi:hypothetical protein
MRTLLESISRQGLQVPLAETNFEILAKRCPEIPQLAGVRGQKSNIFRFVLSLSNKMTHKSGGHVDLPLIAM